MLPVLLHFPTNLQPQSNLCNQAQISNLSGNFGKPMLCPVFRLIYHKVPSIEGQTVDSPSLLCFNMNRNLNINLCIIGSWVSFPAPDSSGTRAGNPDLRGKDADSERQ
jgi:hypothetical protein